MTTDNPAHCGVATQTVGIVHIFVPAETAEDGLAEQPDHPVPPVLASAAVGKNLASHFGKLDGIIQLPISKQTGV